MNIRSLVSRIEDVLGPEADLAQVEALALTALDHADTSSRSGSDIALCIRSLSLQVSLLDCSSRLPQTVRARAYDKIRRAGAPLAGLAEVLEALYEVPIRHKHLAVTPVSYITQGLSRDECISIAQILDTAAQDVGTQTLSGFAVNASSVRGAKNNSFFNAIPAALATTSRLHAEVDCGSSETGLAVDTLLHLGSIMAETARIAAQRGDTDASGRLVASCHPSPLSTGTGASVLHLGIDVSEEVLHTLENADANFNLDVLFQTIKQTVYQIAVEAFEVGHECVDHMNRRTGIEVSHCEVDLIAIPFFGNNPLRLALLNALGIETMEEAGAEAALAFLREAVRQGYRSAFLSPQHGKTSRTVFPPGLYNFLAESRLIAIPGNTSAETIAGFLLDYFASAIQFERPVQVCVVPVQGKHPGDQVDLGDPYGLVSVLPVRSSTHGFIRRGGQFPRLGRC